MSCIFSRSVYYDATLKNLEKFRDVFIQGIENFIVISYDLDSIKRCYSEHFKRINDYLLATVVQQKSSSSRLDFLV